MPDTTPRPKGVDTLIRETERLRDPLAAVERCAQTRTVLDTTRGRVTTLTRDVITNARDAGATWSQISERLGVSNQRAQQLAREAN